MRAWRWTPVLMAVLMVLAAGCSSDESSGAEVDATAKVSTTTAATGPVIADRETYRVAVDPGLLLLPGEALAEGHRVLEGSAAVGRAFPYLRQDGRGSIEAVGWQALLVIDGDPLAVWDAYAADLGIGDKASAVDACLVRSIDAVEGDDAPPLEVLRTLTMPVIEGEGFLDCKVSSTEGVTMRLRSGSYLCIEAEDAGCDGAGSNHLWISVGNEPNALGYEELEPPLYPPGGDEIVPPALGSGPLGPDLPTDGDRWDAGLDHFLDGEAIATIPERWRLLVAPARMTPCGGVVTVAIAPGAPAEVATVLADQAGNLDDQMTLTETPDGGAWAGGELLRTGGFGVSQIAVDRGDGSSLVLLWECGD